MEETTTLKHYIVTPKITKDMIYPSPRPRDAKGRFVPYRDAQRTAMAEALRDVGRRISAILED